MILVTGGTGTVGTATARALAAAGVPFKVASRTPGRATAGEWVRFDWDDPGSYLPAFQGVKRLLLLPPISDRAVGYTMQAMAAAKRAGVEHVVKLSVIGADAEPGILLGRQHAAGEREIRASGLAWTMLRPTFFLQNFLNYYGLKRDEDGTIYLAHGDGKASWVDANDVGEVAAAVLREGPAHAGKVYDLTGPAAVSDAEIVATLGAAWGRRYQYVAVPPEAAAEAMAGMGAPLWMIDGFAELDWLIREGYGAGVADGVRQVLGRPARSVAEFAASLK